MFRYISILIACIFFSLSISNQLKAQDTLHMHVVVQGACGMCQDRIEGIASGHEHVYSAVWSSDDFILHLDHHPNLDSMKLHQSIADAGHDTHLIEAKLEDYNSLAACCQYRDEELSKPETQEENISQLDSNAIHTDIFVDGICGMCQDRIEAVAAKNKNVIQAFWEIETRTLHVDHNNKFNSNVLQRAIARVGHDTELMKAPAFAYHELHACCKYRDQAVVDSHNPSASEENEIDENIIQGIILERNNVGEEEFIIGANVYWSGTTQGTTTDVDGYFQLPKQAGSDQLVVSYIGYSNDTLTIDEQKHIEIVMSEATMMREVVIKHKKRATEVSFLSVGKQQVIGEKELLKAACCNLSESFETNPTVDASVTDAVTGTRQIKMLGLAGPNIQITREGIPDIRGLSAIYGLTFTPGTWIQGININTGAGSVVNGFESIAGQIDVALKKPDQSERFYLNIYGNEMSRIEGTVNFSHRFNDKVSTGILLHGSIIPTKHERNNDGFLDHPISDQFVGMNRWKFYGENGLEGQAGIKYTSLDNRSGQAHFDHNADKGSESIWGARIQLSKYEGWAKMGKVFPSKPHASIGVQLSASYFDQEAYFGLRDYNGDQSSFYSNLIYQSIISDTRHKFKMGLSFQWDKYNEQVVAQSFTRNENVPGAFFEYAYKPNEKLSVVLGLRGDVHNNYGGFITPRLHMRYAVNDQTVFRLSGGRGQRTASIFAEHIGAFASSREINILGANDNGPYGLDAEVSWSAGFNFVREFTINQRALLFQFDLYHTGFSNQIVADYDASPRTLNFYNLDGKSYSNSLQLQVDYEFVPRFDVRVAYRFNDVQTTYSGVEQEKPLTGRERAFINMQYTTLNDWSFDFTLNWQGRKRLPSTAANPEPFQLDNYSPDYFMSNAQISKSWNKSFDIYIGAMNLFNYNQADPIISANEPFSDYFDSSIVWAPIFGREIYGGIRYRIK